MTEATKKDRRLISSRRDGRVILDGVDVIMLGSNDYLGLSRDERVLTATREALGCHGAGAGVYPVFAMTPVNEELYEGLAGFLSTKAAMLYSSGGSANFGVLTTLVEEGDVIISDRLDHASIIDGCRLSRADVVACGNRNVEELRTALENAGAGRRKLIVTDGIFSKEGVQRLCAKSMRSRRRTTHF
jgi:7-keto-8-aminopelargonate synthetase-like enzyme